MASRPGAALSRFEVSRTHVQNYQWLSLVSFLVPLLLSSREVEHAEKDIFVIDSCDGNGLN